MRIELQPTGHRARVPAKAAVAAVLGHGDLVCDVRTGTRGRVEIPRPTVAERAAGATPAAQVVWEAQQGRTDLHRVITHLVRVHPVELSGGGW